VRFEVVEREGRLQLGGSAPEREGSGEGDGTAMPDLYVAQAIADLAARENVPEADITVVDVTRTEFSDASLGVPEPDMMYAQVITPGYVIELALGDTLYSYHAAGERVVLAPLSETGDAGGQASKQVVAIPEIGLSFAVPGDWERADPEFVWTLTGDDAIRLGANWVLLEPPMEAEAVLLPSPAQVLDAEPVDLGWAQGRQTTLEVYAPAEEQATGEQAPVVGVETHVLIVVLQGDSRLGVDFYLSATTAEALADYASVLDGMVQSASMTGLAPAAGQDLTAPALVEVPADWQSLTVEGAADAGWRFTLSFPPDWTTKEMNPKAGMPEDWPTVTMIQLYPQSWADRLERTGAPDPPAPPSYIPLTLEVVVGPEAQLRRAYVPPVATEAWDVNGVTMVREIERDYEEMTPVRYVIQHPDHPEVWIVLGDMISGFVARAEADPDVVDVIPVVVGSLRVEQ
jgi:hypothetical protein